MASTSSEMLTQVVAKTTTSSAFLLEKVERIMDSFHGSERRRLTTFIDPQDHVGFSFMLATGIMLSSTVFFFFQVALVPRRWANSMVVAGLVTGVAWNHYMHMKEIWKDRQDDLQLGQLTVYRYMDW